MSFECTGRRKLSELVSYHVLGNVYRNKFVSVVYSDGMADKVRRDHAGAGPGLDDFFLLGTLVHGQNLHVFR